MAPKQRIHPTAVDSYLECLRLAGILATRQTELLIALIERPMHDAARRQGEPCFCILCRPADTAAN